MERKDVHKHNYQITTTSAKNAAVTHFGITSFIQQSEKVIISLKPNIRGKKSGLYRLSRVMGKQFNYATKKELIEIFPHIINFIQDKP